eukprot:TRINITY_DN7575_c0_g1_i1.p1 TRINITY_DN7575_c0_g1~~TRINITY_DN7575_c0_g1_i1.p1  ORF type:complete len:784 (+),score=206.10 TRINITY_DN7575_c0_g1_i1:67-2352(+)
MPRPQQALQQPPWPGSARQGGGAAAAHARRLASSCMPDPDGDTTSLPEAIRYESGTEATTSLPAECAVPPPGTPATAVPHGHAELMPATPSEPPPAEQSCDVELLSIIGVPRREPFLSGALSLRYVVSGGVGDTGETPRRTPQWAPGDAHGTADFWHSAQLTALEAAAPLQLLALLHAGGKQPLLLGTVTIDPTRHRGGAGAAPRSYTGLVPLAQCGVGSLALRVAVHFGAGGLPDSAAESSLGDTTDSCAPPPPHRLRSPKRRVPPTPAQAPPASPAPAAPAAAAAAADVVRRQSSGAPQPPPAQPPSAPPLGGPLFRVPRIEPGELPDDAPPPRRGPCAAPAAVGAARAPGLPRRRSTGSVWASDAAGPRAAAAPAAAAPAAAASPPPRPLPLPAPTPLPTPPQPPAPAPAPPPQVPPPVLPAPPAPLARQWAPPPAPPAPPAPLAQQEAQAHTPPQAAGRGLGSPPPSAPQPSARYAAPPRSLGAPQGAAPAVPAAGQTPAAAADPDPAPTVVSAPTPAPTPAPVELDTLAVCAQVRPPAPQLLDSGSPAASPPAAGRTLSQLGPAPAEAAAAPPPRPPVGRCEAVVRHWFHGEKAGNGMPRCASDIGALGGRVVVDAGGVRAELRGGAELQSVALEDIAALEAVETADRGCFYLLVRALRGPSMLCTLACPAEGRRLLRSAAARGLAARGVTADSGVHAARRQLEALMQAAAQDTYLQLPPRQQALLQLEQDAVPIVTQAEGDYTLPPSGAASDVGC